VHIYPDGGVARLRVWGRVLRMVDVGRMRHRPAGHSQRGRGIIANDEHYGAVAT